MKVHGQIECLVCVDSFKTIDVLLLQEGMYQLRISLALEDENDKLKIPLLPRETFNMTKPQQLQIRHSIRPKQKIPIPHSTGFKERPSFVPKPNQKAQEWVPAHILKDYNMFCTSAFLIRTWTEEDKIQIQNGCRFTATIPYKFAKLPLFMEVELMFNDLSQFSSVGQFKSIAIAKYRINSVASGVFEYIPVVFNEEHFHLVNLTFYGLLTEYKFKTQKSQSILQENPMISYLAQYNNSHKNNSKQQLKQLKDLYNAFVQPLRNSYTALSDMQNHIDQELFNAERKSSTGGSHVSKLVYSKSQALLPRSCLKDIDSMEPEGRKSFTNSLTLIQDNDLQQVLMLSKSLATEFQITQSLIHQSWLKLYNTVKQKNHQIIRNLKVVCSLNTQIRFHQFVSKEVIPIIDHSLTTVPSIQKMNQDQEECLGRRNQYAQSSMGPSKVLDCKLLKEIRDKFVLLEKHYQTSKSSFKLDSDRFTYIQQKGRIHLVIFVHGYHGHPYDMHLLQNYLCFRFPAHMYMISISNQNGTEGDILRMGSKLAEEIQEFILQWCPDKTLHKITFVAHSLGGLIVRAALPHLQNLSDKMHTLITLGSPHLGYIHNKHNLIKFGLWMLQVFKKSTCLQQLQMKDAQRPEDTLMMTLSKYTGLNWFKNLIFLSSTQDHYVTPESALMMKVDSENTDIHNQLAHNVLKNLQQSEIIRITVDYNFETGDLDTFLGRKAHIAVLDSHFLIQYIVYTLGDYFK